MTVSVNRVEEALFQIEDCITLPEAEALLKSQGFKTTKMSMIVWLRTYPIGQKVGGRWYVHPNSLALLLEGRLKKRLKKIEKN